MLRGEMLIDQRGSEVLARPECLRLLAVAARSEVVGHLAVSTDTAPIVHPVNFAYEEGQVVLRLGEGFMVEAAPGRLVAFEVDATGSAPDGRPVAWSVLVRGLVTSARRLEDAGRPGSGGPRPTVPEPGEILVHIRPDAVSGRRFRPRPASAGP